MHHIEPGTYRITNVRTSTCIGVRDEWRAVCLRVRNEKEQQWYIQRCGGGYCIKNSLNGAYLAVSDAPSDQNGDTTWMYCGRYPTVWNIRPGNKYHGTFIIEHGDNGRAIDLAGASADDGANICTYPIADWAAHRRWKFERLSDDPGEEELRIRDQMIDQYKAQVAAQDAELAQLKEQLVSQSKELSRVKQELVEESARLSEARRFLPLALEQMIERELRLRNNAT